MTPLALQVQVQRLPGAEAPEPLPLPTRATAGASGYDLHAALRQPLVLAPGARAAVPTGFAFAIPPGFEGQVRARSGLARLHGVTVLNGVGTLDADYRGEVSVLLVNLGAEPVTLHRGDRVAQLVFAAVATAHWQSVSTLEATPRGAGGFGHTGLGPGTAVGTEPAAQAEGADPVAGGSLQNTT